MKELKILVLVCMLIYLAPIGTLFGMIGMGQTLPVWVNVIYYMGAFALLIFSNRIMNWIVKDPT